MILAVVLALGMLGVPLEAQAVNEPTAAGAVTVSGWRLNIRQQPNTGSPIVGHLYKGSYIALIAREGSWWQVEYADGQFGWCHADYITPVQGTPARVNTVWGNLNVRSGPGTGYERTAVLPRGKPVLLLSTANGWSRILYHGTRSRRRRPQLRCGGRKTGRSAG